MRAMDVMTTDVITVDPDTTVQALATLLAERGISGAPVVDSSGRLVGIISEGDLAVPAARAFVSSQYPIKPGYLSQWIKLAPVG